MTVEVSSQADLLHRIEKSGIVGMGGAGFPTARKIQIALENQPTVLVINAGATNPDCSPDPTLVAHFGNAVRDGVCVLQRILDPTRTVLALNRVVTLENLDCWRRLGVAIHRLDTTFPEGEEASVIQQTLGMRLPQGTYPADVGVCVLNVATVFAVAEAVLLGQRPSDRLVAAAGRTLWVRFGTEVRTVMGGQRPIRIGGRWSGDPARGDEAVDSSMFAIWSGPVRPPHPCIRCGACDESCPLDLPVERLEAEAISGTLGVISRACLSACYECGACVDACPSDIPVLDHLRTAKRTLAMEARAATVADVSLRRFERRTRRIEQDDRDSARNRHERMQRTRRWEETAEIP